MLSAEERVARRKQRAREYSRRARERHQAQAAELAELADALGLARDIMELAPNVYLTLSPDVQALVLYANTATRRALGMDPAAILGR
jgi:hypothetical protein